MYPILYGPSETIFDTNGLGRLSDCISCIVTEERNGQYELEMVYPLGGIHSKDIVEDRIILAMTNDKQIMQSQYQPFIIYNISKPLNGLITIYAHHVSYLLNRMTVAPFQNATSPSAALSAIEYGIYGTHPFTFLTDKTSDGTMSVEVPTKVRALLGGIEGSVLDSFGGGEYEFDRWTVKLWANRGTNNGVTIRYGKNLTELDSESDYSNTYTAVVPFWKGQSDDGDDEVIVGSVVNSGHQSEYAYQQTIPYDVSSEFEAKPTADQVTDRAARHLANSRPWLPNVNLEVDFIPLNRTTEFTDEELSNLERVSLCDTVTIIHELLGINVVAKVIRTVFNVLTERYDSIEVGDPRTSLADTIGGTLADENEKLRQEVEKSLSGQKTYMNKAIAEATAKLVGGQGGCIILKPNSQTGYPEEMLIMNTSSESTATYIIRLNQAGIGFSSDGGKTYKNAWTIDGTFNTEFITALTLSANNIKGGTLSLGGGTIGGNGSLIVYDANSKVATTLDKNGFKSFGKGTNQTYYEFTVGTTKYRVPLANDMTVDKGLIFFEGGTNQSSGKSFISTSEIQRNVGGAWESITYSGLKFFTTGAGVVFTLRGANRIMKLDGDNNSLEVYGYNQRGQGSYISADAIEFQYYKLKYENRALRTDQAIYANGFYINGTSNKAKVMSTDNYGDRVLYCYETSAPMFGDIGEGFTDDMGLAYIAIDDVFSEAIETESEYQVFLQKECDCNIWVEEKAPAYFVVKGTPRAKFAWEVKAKQKLFNSARLERYEDCEPVELSDADFYEKEVERDFNEQIPNYIYQEEALYETVK